MERKGLFYIFLLLSGAQGSDISIVVEQRVDGCSSGCADGDSANDASVVDAKPPPGESANDASVVDTTTPPPPEFDCSGADYVKRGDSCYFFSPAGISKTFPEAEALCLSKSMAFVKINDEAEYQFLKDKTMRNEYYIGLDKRDDPNTWVWTADGTPAQYFKWQSGYPQSEDAEPDYDCVLINYLGTYDMKNSDCGLQNRYICETL